MIEIKKISPFIIFSEETVLNALKKISENQSRIVFAVTEHGVLEGCLSDGDFRKWLLDSKDIDLNMPITKLLNRDLITATPETGRAALESKFKAGVDAIPVIDQRGHIVSVFLKKSANLIIENFTIGEESPVFIIAEIGNNHNGSLELAKRLIDEAVGAGADCVKFQARDMKSLYSNEGNPDDIEEDLGSQYTLDLLSRFQLSREELQAAFDYAREKKVVPMCTPWDLSSLDFLDACGIPAFKIASADLTNHELIRAAGEKGKPIICSTGMSTETEINETVQLVKSSGIPSIFLHCNSTYPAPFKDVNLQYLKRLRDITGFSVGYSGHERGIHIAVAAVALGARVIEKHFTLDRDMEGNDHKVSLLPAEFAEMVRGIREVEESFGKGKERNISQGEMMNRENLAKSLVINQALQKGQTITRSMIEIRSPGKGLQPNKIDLLIGRPAPRDYVSGDFFYETDFFSGASGAKDYSFRRPWGLPVRYHDLERLQKKSNLDLVEFHFSYKDLEHSPEKYLRERYDMDVVVHSPELFQGDHILDLCSPDEDYRKRSIGELQRVVEITKKLKPFFRGPENPLIVVNVGGFSREGFVSPDEAKAMTARLEDSLGRIDAAGVELIPQTMPPFPWHFGGQSYHNLFVTAKDIEEFCVRNQMRVCLDVSHSYLAANHMKVAFSDFLERVAPFAAHLHIADGEGLDGEGLQISEGTMDFANVARVLDSKAAQASFIPEIWQGHKNEGEGFWKALEKLERWF
ncbi:MAG: N-acetylneuraminate synthase family protein [bacterium]|nr:N-acetylneuraminate synthase family protein [bacterium]